MKDEFGDRMKTYERRYTNSRITPDNFLCVRIDGKGFSKYTNDGCIKPYDFLLSNAFQNTTRFLVEETHANVGYTQSDEITLLYSVGDKAKEHIFGGKTSKINSILASMTTAYFNEQMSDFVSRLAYFDCRCWAIRGSIEASNVLLWRAQDARKNSISSAYRWTLGHAKMHGLSGAQMIQELSMTDKPWEIYPDDFRYGSFFKTVYHDVPKSEFPFPEKIEGDFVKRGKVEKLELGYFGDLSLERRIEVADRSTKEDN